MKIKLAITVLVLAITTIFSIGCNAPTAKEASAPKSAKPQVGETAVIRLNGSSYDGTYYLSGKVSKIEGENYEVTRNDNNLEKAVAADVYPFPKEGSRIDAKPGDYVVVNTLDRAWTGGEVVSANDSTVEVKVPRSYGVIKVSPDKVIKVSPEATEAIKKALEAFTQKGKTN